MKKPIIFKNNTAMTYREESYSVSDKITLNIQGKLSLNSEASSTDNSISDYSNT